MYKTIAALVGAVLISVMIPSTLDAQLADRKVITLEGAKNMMAAAEAEANSNGWTVAIAIVDEAGDLIAFRKIDGTQAGSIDVAIGKARTAARLIGWFLTEKASMLGGMT